MSKIILDEDDIRDMIIAYFNSSGICDNMERTDISFRLSVDNGFQAKLEGDFTITSDDGKGNIKVIL